MKACSVVLLLLVMTIGFVTETKAALGFMNAKRKEAIIAGENALEAEYRAEQAGFNSAEALKRLNDAERSFAAAEKIEAGASWQEALDVAGGAAKEYLKAKLQFINADKQYTEASGQPWSVEKYNLSKKERYLLKLDASRNLNAPVNSIQNVDREINDYLMDFACFAARPFERLCNEGLGEIRVEKAMLLLIDLLENVINDQEHEDRSDLRRSVRWALEGFLIKEPSGDELLDAATVQAHYMRKSFIIRLLSYAKNLDNHQAGSSARRLLREEIGSMKKMSCILSDFTAQDVYNFFQKYHHVLKAKLRDNIDFNYLDKLQVRGAGQIFWD